MFEVRCEDGVWSLEVRKNGFGEVVVEGIEKVDGFGAEGIALIDLNDVGRERVSNNVLQPCQFAVIPRT